MSVTTGVSVTCSRAVRSLIDLILTPHRTASTNSDHFKTHTAALLNMGVVKSRKSKATGKESQLQKAIIAYQRQQYTSIRKCADAFGVPYSTLRDRLNGGRVSKMLAHAEQQLLLPQQERGIVNWIIKLDGKGFPPRVDMVVTMAKQILQRQNPSKLHEIGQHWISRFLNRHPQLVSKFSTQVNKQRVQAFEPEVIRRCFDRLQPVIQKRQIKPENTYNMDEKGILMGLASKVKVICVRGRKQALLKQGIVDFEFLPLT